MPCYHKHTCNFSAVQFCPPQELTTPHLRSCTVATAASPSIVMATEYPEYQVEFEECQGGVVQTLFRLLLYIIYLGRELTHHNNIHFNRCIIYSIVQNLHDVVLCVYSHVFQVLHRCKLWHHTCQPCSYNFKSSQKVGFSYQDKDNSVYIIIYIGT